MKKSNLKFCNSMLFNILGSKHFPSLVGPGYIICSAKLCVRMPSVYK